LLLLPLLAPVGAEAGPLMRRAEERQACDAFDRLDLAGIVEELAPDATLVDELSRRWVRGRAAVAEQLQGCWRSPAPCIPNSATCR
jgi:hypothetical protein